MYLKIFFSRYFNSPQLLMCRSSVSILCSLPRIYFLRNTYSMFHWIFFTDTSFRLVLTNMVATSYMQLFIKFAVIKNKFTYSFSFATVTFQVFDNHMWLWLQYQTPQQRILSLSQDALLDSSVLNIWNTMIKT